jgi:cell surface protein SprA
LPKATQIVSFFLATSILVAGWWSFAENHDMKRLFAFPNQQAPGDSTKVNVKYKPSRRPNNKPKNRYGDPLTNKESKSPMQLKTPDNIKTTTSLDTTQETFEITEKAGDVDYRPPTEMNFKDYAEWRNKQIAKDYWKSKSESNNGGANTAISAKPKGLNPRIQMPPVFDRIFGGNYIDIKPNGMVLLDFGGQYQKTNNPAIPIRQQKSGGFKFDQQISFNMVGKVGERLTIKANWDTKATFDFDNNIKIEYKALEQDIIKRIELGNVSMPTNSALITGAQNLFGVKAQLQFGRLMVTAVAANQRSKVDEIVIPGGSSGPGKEYEIAANQYDENRHFWLGQFFRNNYDKWMASSPFITSGVQINRVEVYVTNRNNTTDNLRNMTCFTDLGEAKPYNKNVNSTSGLDSASSNKANDLFGTLKASPTARVGDTSYTSNSLGFKASTDFEIIRSARQLVEGKDFRVNKQLGYISFNTQLRNDDVVGVAYEYTYNGQTYKVGELTEEYQVLKPTESVFLKLLRPALINVKLPTWNLMMKNVYQLPATNISRNGFQLRVIYKDDNSGIDNSFLQEGTAKPVFLNGGRTSNPTLRDLPLVQLFNVDNLNPNGDPGPDGNWDYIQGVSIDSANGRIIFGVKEPFGKYLEQFYDTVSEEGLITKYVYRELYEQTKNNALQITTKNKFFLKGRAQSGNTQEIQLQGLNIAQGSIRVLSGSTTLVEGSDYTVNYELGRVRIVNPGILTSGNDITIRFEKADLFNFRQKSMLGARLDYRVHKDFNIGGTFMHLRERPLITRVTIGDDPIFNTMWGLDVNYSKESRFLTKMVDALPLIQTKEPSNITLKAEVAQLLPGTPPQVKVDGEANMFIDDFEGSETPYDLTRQPIKWILGSPPKEFFDADLINSDPLSFTYKRAKLSWYNIDQTAFYQQSGQSADISEEERLSRHYTRLISPQEIYPQRSLQAAQVNEPTLDLAYFPEERGMYNFNPNITSEGKLPDPKKNFASLTRAITFDTDFDNANIQYIEFWMMDPFIAGNNGNIHLDGGNTVIDNSLNPGGELWFQLGSVSEDIMKDSKQSFENGLPPDGGSVGTTITDWGKVTQSSYINNAFSNLGGARDNQDVGLDGLKSSEEFSFSNYNNFINAVKTKVNDPTKRDQILADISGDDFKYYLSVDSKSIIDRYRNYNGMENNSSTNTVNGFIQSNTNIPDNEDLNQNNNVDATEQYFEYKVSLKRGGDGKLDERSNGFVVSKITNNKGGDDVTWYQMRIPLRTNAVAVNNMNDFKSIRFLRMVVAGWEKPVILRMAQFQMVGSLWRPLDSLANAKTQIGKSSSEPTKKGKVQLSTVNVEENGSPDGGITPYVVPPGFIRDKDNTSNLNRLQNEQSLRICVDKLEPGDVAPAYKLINLNFINSKRIKMFLHAESSTARDFELEGFLRIGTDFDQNYYDIRIPLKLTPPGSTDPNIIWPSENDMDVPLEDLSWVKAERNKANIPYSQIFSVTINGKIISIRGNPDYTSTQVAMIGIQNPITNSQTHQICIWADELRTSGVNKEAGWAAVGTMNAKLADLANVTATGSYKSSGFGAIDQKISARQRNNTYQYGAASNISMDKFIPVKTGLKVPVYVSYDRKIVKPEYDPTNPDLKLSQSLSSITDADERESHKNLVIDQSTRRSISINNMQKSKVKPNTKNHFYDVENLSLTVGYNDIRSSNYLTQRYFFKNYKAGIGYTYTVNSKALEPLKGIKSQSRYIKLISDFNITPLPSNLSFRTDLDRRYAITQLRAGDLTTNGVKPLYEKSFTMNRAYGLRWGFTKSLGLDYRANVNTIIDEPFGEINEDPSNPKNPNSISKKDSVLKNLQKFGRVKNFDQNFMFTYKTPLDKIPLTDWTQADINYNANYIWKAGALGYADTLGNQAQNTRTIGVNGKMDFLKLFNKLKFLKEVNSPLKQVTQDHDQKRNVWRKQLENPTIKPKERDSLNKLINKVYLSEVKPVRGVLQTIMLFKNLNFTYERSEGTVLPGFLPKPKYFGLDENSMAPGIPFILGDQDADRIKKEALDNEWIAKSRFQSSPFIQTKGTKFTYRTSIEPIRQFRIQFDGKQEQTQTYTDFFRYDVNGQLDSKNPTRSGSFKTSYITALTAFTKDDPLNNKNPTFEKYVENRNVIKERLNANNNGSGRYDTNSQDVVIPAFLAAYSGRDADKIALTSFPKIPLPNWRIDYGGLSSLAFIKRFFTSVNLNHSYTSTYSVANYTSSLTYGSQYVSSKTSIFNLPNGDSLNSTSGTIVPVYVIGQVSIQEGFSPLLGINMKTKKNITFNIRYNLTRNLNLSTTNSQVMEMRNQDWSVSVGYTKTGMKLPIKYKQRVMVLKNEITFRFDFTIRDSRTVQRRPNDINVITQGIQQIQIKPTINYRVNDRLSLQLYYDQSVTIPKVSNSFKRTNTLFGVQIRFSLS